MSEENESKIALYRVYSIFENLAGRKDVRVDWFAINRKTPVAPYAEVIKDFGDDQYWDYHTSKHVDEFFNYSEADSVKWDTVSMVDEEAFLEEVSLPVERYEDNYKIVALEHRENRKLSKLTGYLLVTELKGFDCPVPYWGYFNLNDTEPTEEILSKARGMAKFLLGKFLETKGLAYVSADEVILRQVEGLYDVYDHYCKEAVDCLTIIALKNTPFKIETGGPGLL